jgi:hypothetical protein
MINKIQEVYERINNEFLSISPFGILNDKKIRLEFKERLENEFTNTFIKCDEENNPPEVIDNCLLVAKLSWIGNNKYKYCDLIFGQPEQVIKLTLNIINKNNG